MTGYSGISTHLIAAVIFCLSSIGALASDDASTRKFDFQFGGDVSKDTQDLITQATSDISQFYSSELGVSIPSRTKVFASGDPKFLAKHNVAQKKIPGHYKQAVKDWTNLRENEAIYGAIFIRTNSNSFNMDVGSGIKNQRMRVMVHELFHIVQYSLVGSRARNCCPSDRVPVIGPTWLVEGSSQYLMYYFEQERGISNLSGWKNHAGGLRKSFKGSLSSFETRRGMDSNKDSYELAALAVHMLVSKAGMPALKLFWQELGNGQKWQTAFKTAFGTTSTEFYATY